MSKSLEDLAKEIIQLNQYMTIASVDFNGFPWASPVAYAYDDSYSLYWASYPASLHQKNILMNPKVAIAIYDSHQDWGEGVGLQIEATVEKVSALELPQVSTLYFSRKYPYGNTHGIFGKGLHNLLQGKIYSLYKATPNIIWVPDPNSDVDSRVEVIIKKASETKRVPEA